MNPHYPIFVVSKGRYRRQLTSRALSKMRVPHFIVVEHQELAEYEAARYPYATLLTLDPQYKRDYDTCDNLGDSKSKGPGAARNFAWDMASGLGSRQHWVMDDNIDGFFRLNYNLKTPVADGTVLRVMEDFVDRYTNVAMAGPNYFMFAPRKVRHRPFGLNTRIYSCNLIRNDLPFRWRGRYNEDTDLSLRMLKANWCTILFYFALQNKMPTQTMKGGNTAEFYAAEGTTAKSQMQVDLHPDVSRMVMRFGRVHHYVDYTQFRPRFDIATGQHMNTLQLKPGLVIPEGTNDYGMVLEQEIDGEWRQIER